IPVVYSKLPLTAPQNCYVATAAARGHQSIVRSTRVMASDGSWFMVNDQLRRLKAAELIIEGLFPKLHRLMRSLYDQLGPPLARQMIGRPLLADAAYLLLKPAEWLL